MAMNLRNPIQLLRGTSAAIAAAQGKEGTLYYDSSRGTLCIRRKDGGLYDLVRSWTASDAGPTIYVDSVNGSDDNTGFIESSPIRSLEKAFTLSTLLASVAKVNIILYPGDYTVAIPRWPTCDIKSKYSDNKANVSINSLVSYAAYPKLYDLNIHLLGHVDTLACYVRVENCNVYIDYNESKDGVLRAARNAAIELVNTVIDGTSKNVYTMAAADFSSAIIFEDVTMKNINATFAVVSVARSSVILLTSAIIDGGNVVGKRYMVYKGGTIETGNRGVNAIPGTIAGTVSDEDAYYY